MPNGLVVQIEPGDALPAGHPATGKGMVGGQPTAYVVQLGNVSEGVTDPNGWPCPDPAAAAAPAAAAQQADGLVMVKAVRFEKPGDSSVLQLVDVDLPPPGKGQVRVKHTAIGVNFIDTYHRTGLYPMPLPSGLGSEAAGVVEAVGEGVTGFKAGDRVGYASGVIGVLCGGHQCPGRPAGEAAGRHRRRGRRRDPAEGHDGAVPAAPDPSGGGRRDHPLPCRGRRRRPDRRAVGQGAGRHRHRHDNLAGKVALCKQNGCDHVLNSQDADWAKQVREITGGKGVPVVYDSIGKATFLAGLDCLRRAASW